MKNRAIVIAALILALAYLFGNRFELHRSGLGGGAAYRMDRLTGEVALCLAEGGTPQHPEIVCK